MASSYTNKEVNTMIDIYTENPCLEVVAKLSVLFNRPRRSIISKLSKEGVYVTRGYRSKSGALPITKLQLVRAIEDALDIKLPGLDKAPKPTLQLLSDTVVDQTQLLEDSLEEINITYDTQRARDEIFEVISR